MSNWLNLLPEAILSISATLILIVSAIGSSPAMRDMLRWLSLLAVVASGVSLYFISGDFGLSNNGWLLATPFTTSVSLVLLTLVGWGIVTSPVEEKAAGEWFSLLLFVGLGSVVLSRIANLPAMFLGVEVLS